MTKKIKPTKLYKFTSIKDLKYNIIKDDSDLIELVISRTPLNLIRYNNQHIFFMHPFFNRYACDINCDVYDIVQLNQPRIYPFQNMMTLYINLNNEDEYPIQYSYSKFILESLKLYKSDIIKHNFKNDYEEAIHIEEDEAYEQTKIKDDIKKYNQHIHDILNYERCDDSSDSDSDSDNDSNNYSD